MNDLSHFIPSLRQTLRDCLACLKPTPPELDIDAYVVKERAMVEAGDALLAAIDKAEAAHPTACIKPVGITVDTGSGKFVEMCFDIMSQAQESACGYWAVSRDNVLDEGRPHAISSSEFKPHNHEGPAFTDGDPRNDWKRIGRDEIAQAMVRIIQEPGLCRSDIRSNVRDSFFDPDYADSIDDEICDVIIQIALFGEIVFG